jgi:hypothetical protein
MAFFEISNAVALHFGLSFNNEIAIHPEPVPISKIFFDFSNSKIFKLSSIINSVSGLGIRTDLSTKNLYFQKCLNPKIYAIGSFFILRNKKLLNLFI